MLYIVKMQLTLLLYGLRVIKSFKAMSIGVVIFDGFEGRKTLGSSTLTGEFLLPNLKTKVTNYCGIHS